MKGITIKTLVFMTVLALLLAACARPTPEAPPVEVEAPDTPQPIEEAVEEPTPEPEEEEPPEMVGETFKIGFASSITGPGSSLGIPERNTAEMIARQLSDQGGIVGPDGVRHEVEIILYDDESNPDIAVSVARRMIEEDRVQVIVAGSLTGNSLEDLQRLPFTTKQDLRDVYPFGAFVVPLEEVVRIHASSGTTGKLTVGGYTRKDLELWREVMARTVTCAGVTNKDVAHNAYGYGLFTGGLGFHLGFEAVGATTVPMSGGLTRRQVMLLEDFGATVLTCTPSYSLVLVEEAADMGIDFKSRMKLRVGIFGAEPWTEEMRAEIEERLGLEAFDIYGLTEIIGPGVSIECEHHNGLHIFEDVFLPEIIDPETGEQLPYGEEGELVFTTLTKEAMPVIRYRTRDRTVLNVEKCMCGRTFVRMEKIRGRTDDMLIVRGVNVFPSLVEKALLSVEGLEPYYQIMVDRPKDQLDKLEVWVEANHRFFEPIDTRALDKLRDDAEQELMQTLGITAEIKLMGPHSIARSDGKAKRVVDKRELYQSGPE